MIYGASQSALCSVLLMADLCFLKQNGFEGALEKVLESRGHKHLKLKPKQRESLQEIIVNKRDCLAILPTGYGKSLIYQLLPSIADHMASVNGDTAKNKSIVIVVSPLNTLIDNQLN